MGAFDFPIHGAPEVIEAALHRIVEAMEPDERLRFFKEMLSASTLLVHDEDATQLVRILNRWHRTAVLRNDPGYAEALAWVRQNPMDPDRALTADALREELDLPEAEVG